MVFQIRGSIATSIPDAFVLSPRLVNRVQILNAIFNASRNPSDHAPRCFGYSVHLPYPTFFCMKKKLPATAVPFRVPFFPLGSTFE